MTWSFPGAESILMMSEGEPSDPPEANLKAINDQESLLPVSGEKPPTLINPKNPDPPETPNVSSSAA